MFAHKLKELRQANLYRSIKDRESPQGARIRLDGREFINFASNDYLGLANHPELINAAKEAIAEHGFGSGSSRLLSGGTVLHKKLEQKIAEFKGVEAALLFNSGYAANTGVIPAIAGEGDVLFSDEFNHASIIDGCRLSKARTVVYKHKDVAHLSELIEKEITVPGTVCGKFVIVTDTVFSMGGDIAPLREIYNLCISLTSAHQLLKPIFFYLDDAHGIGVIGNGKGGLAHFNINPEPWIIQMGTFSKALGSYGAFVAGSRDMIDWLVNTARSFMFSTVMPSCAVAASLKAVELLETKPDLTKKLWRMHDRFVNLLSEMGYSIESETPIIRFRAKSNEDALNAARFLYEKGLYVPAIRPPAVKEPGLRATITSAHSDNDIDMLAVAISDVGHLNCPI